MQSKRILKIISTFVLITFVLPIGGVLAQDQPEQQEGDMPRMGAWEACALPENLSGDIPIGLNLGLTGATSLYSVPQQQGMALAIDEINAAGYLGEAELVGIVEDSGPTPEGAISAMEKLLFEDDVVAVIGPTFSTQAFAADPIAQEAGVPVLGITNLAEGITDMGNYIFRMGLLDNMQIPAAVNATVDLLDIETAAVIYSDNDEFTVTGFEVFLDILDERGVDIIAEETFQTGDVDFSAQLTNIIGVQPDALMISALGAEAIPLLNQARNLGFNGPIIGNNGLNAPALLTEGGNNADGVILGAAWHISSENPLNQAFVEAFEARYDFLPDQFAAQAYTAVWIMATAIRCQDSAQPEAIRAGLDDISDLATPLGEFGFDDQRDPVHDATVQIIIDGQFRIMTAEAVAEIYE